MPTAFARLTATLRAMRILVVEDNVLIGMCIEDMLIDFGCEVIKATRYAQALRIAQTFPLDGAFLDVNVGGAPVYPAAQELQTRSIPFAFVTGYAAIRIPLAFRAHPVLTKPVIETEFLKVAASFARQCTTG